MVVVIILKSMNTLIYVRHMVNIVVILPKVMHIQTL